MKLKNVMLGIVGGLFTLSVATISCSKDSTTTPPPTAPTITGNPNPSTDTVGKSAVITITGTKLTGASVTTTTSGITIGTATVAADGNSLTVNVTIGSSVAPGVITLKVTTSGGSASTSLTVVAASYSGPTSNDIASTNLLAHWTFDADSKEFYSNQPAATNVGVDFSQAGKIGNCATFTNGYLLYAPAAIAQLNRDTALESYSISMWVNIAPSANNILRSLFQVNPTTYPDIWGAVSFSLNNNGAGTDTLPLRADQVQVAGRGPIQATTSSNYAGGAGKWTFITETYDGNGTNQTMKIFADGNMIDSTQFNDVDKPETFRIIPGGGPAFVGTPTNYVSIGTLAFKDRGNTAGDGYGNMAPNVADRPWAAGSISGKIDDIRLFNRALSSAEVLALYTIGSTGH